MRKRIQEGEATSSNKIARHDSLEDVGTQSLMIGEGPSESDYRIWAFLADRLEDSYFRNIKHKEYHPNCIRHELPDWSEKQIREEIV